MAITTNDYAHSVCRLLRKHTSNHWIDVLRLVSKRNMGSPQNPENNVR
nr:hypothetical protein [Pseudomonas putida]